jgi:hypothetical protein
MALFRSKDEILSHKTLGQYFGLVMIVFIVTFYGVAYWVGSSNPALKFNALFFIVPLLFMLIAPFVAFLFHYYKELRELKQHQADLIKFCADHKYAFSVAPAWQGISVFSHMSLLQLGERDAEFTNCIEAGDWRYGEFSYAVYRSTRNGEQKEETVYYGVMAAELPRVLPNVFFDSKKARGRQFRFHFAGSQVHSLEGDFDEHFVTYFPEDYTIDSMSFITPEVMWAMREAADYDIEISGNQLFLYAPIYHDENRLHDMAGRLLEIKKKLLNNIVTYRDERLPLAEGRKAVAAQGIKLQRSKVMQRVTIVFGIVWFILYVWAEMN